MQAINKYSVIEWLSQTPSATLRALTRLAAGHKAAMRGSMTGLFFALLATVVVGLGARDQVLVGQLSGRHGPRPAILLVACISGTLAAVLAAWGGVQVAGMTGGSARLFLVALAVGLAGLELIVLSPRPAPREPTHSLGAFALVLFAMQLTDAARFMIFALAVLTRAPITTAMGGAVGAMLVVAAGWSGLFGAAPKLRPIRRMLGVLLLMLAAALGAPIIARS